MRSIARIRIDVLTVLCLVLSLCGVVPLLAAAGSVKGSVKTTSGAIPQGSVIRATQLPERTSTSRTAIGADGTFSFPELLPGIYVFDVLDPSGKVIGWKKADITASAENVLSLSCTPAGAAVANGGVSKATRWAWIGGAAGAFTLAAVERGRGDDNRCDRDISPVKPGRQCP